MERSTSPFSPDVDLSRFDDEYARASTQAAQQPFYDEIPDGFYDASIEEVQIGQTANTGNPMIVWKLRIQGPECRGKAITKVRVITDKTVAFLKQDLERLEVHLERLSDLPDRVDEMIERPVRILKRTNPQRRWTDVFFVSGRKGPASEGRQSGQWATGTDDDLPF
jgi:hypothetical protein